MTDCYLPRLGGIERQVSGLAAAQIRLGHDVEVITSVPAGPACAPDHVVVHRPLTGRGPDSGPTRIHYGRSAAGVRTALQGRYDVVHVHASTFSPLAYLTARAAAGRTPTALTLHSLWAWATPIFRAADLVTGWRDWPVAWSAVSAVAAESLAAELRQPNVTVLPNAVDLQLWAPLPDRVRPDGLVRIATTMRLAARKRPRELLRIMRAVRAAVPDRIRLELDIIGDGPLAGQVRTAVRELGMSDWVRLLGQRPAPEIRARYASTDIYVSPARLESFGIAALEARAVGLPVVALASTGTADFIRDGTEGLLAADDTGLVDALVRLCCSPDLRHALSTHNRTVAPQQTWTSVTRSAQELYDRAVRIGGGIPSLATVASADG